MELETGNLFEGDDWPAAQQERHRDLFAGRGAVRVAQIESNAHATPEGEYYDQDDDEWVVVIAGDGVIEFDDGTWHAMTAGDWVRIPAHARHRVAGTSDRTLWLAVYLRAGT